MPPGPCVVIDRKSNIYSDRPRLVMASEILTGGIFMVFAAYTEVYESSFFHPPTLAHLRA